VLLVERLVGPLVSPFFRLESFLARATGEEGSTQEEREVREITSLGQREGVVGKEEHQLVERAFRLDELSVWDVMTPRVGIFAWKDSLTLEEIVGELESVPFSRVPVFGESVDDVTGILYLRDAYQGFIAGEGKATLKALSRDPFFVPGSLSLTRLLRDFQARRIHMGIVADEFGGTDGLVTLEDVLEELVGEIEDETDLPGEPLVRISKTEVIADGALDLRDINYAFHINLPQSEHRSLNGFIIDEFGYVPQKGETLEKDGVRIDVVDASETQVVRARVRKLPGSEPKERS
jgi:CBS domain containing-hemolysin-like protein